MRYYYNHCIYFGNTDNLPVANFRINNAAKCLSVGGLGTCNDSAMQSITEYVVLHVRYILTGKIFN